MASKKEDSGLEGKKIPVFKIPSTSGGIVSAMDFKKISAVIYFYPKDSTSGCTKEGEDFRDYFSKFKKLGLEIYGVSRDSLKSHDKFREKYAFPFDLLSDENEKMCKAFDVLQMKSMYGRKFLGIERSTFYVKNGVVIREWRKVKVPGHVQEVYEFIKNN